MYSSMPPSKSSPHSAARRIIPRPADRPGVLVGLHLDAPGTRAEGHHQVDLLAVLVTEVPEPEIGIGPPGQVSNWCASNDSQQVIMRRGAVTVTGPHSGQLAASPLSTRCIFGVLTSRADIPVPWPEAANQEQSSSTRCIRAPASVEAQFPERPAVFSSDGVSCRQQSQQARCHRRHPVTAAHVGRSLATMLRTIVRCHWRNGPDCGDNAGGRRRAG